jgi:hypothetical protein
MPDLCPHGLMGGPCDKCTDKSAAQYDDLASSLRDFARELNQAATIMPGLAGDTHRWFAKCLMDMVTDG